VYVPTFFVLPITPNVLTERKRIINGYGTVPSVSVAASRTGNFALFEGRQRAVVVRIFVLHRFTGKP
jgi:hypothetical protein